MHGTETCNLKKQDIQLLGFTVTRFLLKIFTTYNISVIQERFDFFNFMLPCILLVHSTMTFSGKI